MSFPAPTQPCPPVAKLPGFIVHFLNDRPRLPTAPDMNTNRESREHLSLSSSITMARKKSGKGNANEKETPDNLSSDTQQLPTRGTALEQDSSPLFNKTPGEIRDMIYDQVFAYTRLSYGEKRIRVSDSVKVKPAPHALALLRTCRRVKEEIGDRWLRQVLLSFADPYAMLDKLTALPDRLLSQVRHVRVRGESIVLSWPGELYDSFHRLSHGLKLIPGLKLDTLTVLSFMPGPNINYDTLNKLICLSDGWKELRFLSASSTLLGYVDTYMYSPDLLLFGVSEEERTIYRRNPQPAYWQSTLERRDGADSRPSVVICRSKIPGGPSSPKGSLMADPSNWVPFRQKDTVGDGKYGLVEDSDIMATATQRDKEILVVARRGKGVDYQEKSDSPYIPGDIRQKRPGKSWKEIRKEGIARLPELYVDDEDDEEYNYSDDEEDDCSDDEEVEDSAVADSSYTRVDEYEWTPIDFGQND